MLRFVGTYLADREDAENVVQDVFIHLWEHRRLWREMQVPQAFLFTLARRRCIDFLRLKVNDTRRVGLLKDMEERELEYKLYSLEALDEDSLSDAELEQRLRQAIDRLPERCRHIFVESKLHRKKHQQVADEMGISVQTVKNQLAIALRKLQAELKDFLPLLVFLFEDNL